MDIDRNSTIPLYKQLQLILQDKILFGELGPEVLLPTEQQLCEQYRISRITVRNTLANLERNGLIVRMRGRGAIVKKRDMQMSFGSVAGFARQIQSEGYATSSKIIKKELVVGNADLLSCFEMNGLEKELFWHFCSLRYLNDSPAVIMNHYVKKALGDKMLEHDLEKTSFYYLFESITKQRIIRSGNWLASVQATPESAKMLSVENGTALMWWRGITYLEGDIPVEVNYSLYVGSKFVLYIGSKLTFASEEFGPNKLGAVNFPEGKEMGKSQV